jgi:hypothetical protein
MRINQRGLAYIVSLLFCFVLWAGFVNGQPVPITPGTVVTGQCQGHESEPGCVLPNLFGSQGLTLANNPVFPHYAHFIGSAQQILNQGVGSAIATQLATLPIISPSSGFTFQYDAAAGAFVRSTTSFGPIYSERAETIGRGKISFGVSYQRFRFGSLDGIDLHNIPAVLTHVPGTGPSGATEPYEADVIYTSNNLSLNMDQTVLYGTVGITDRIDFSVAIPIASVRFGAVSNASIIRVSGTSFMVSPTLTVPNPHVFPNGTLNSTYTSNGSATGIGDVTFRVKGNVFRGQNFQVATILDVRAPTGDAREFLGSGAVGIKPFIAISGRKRFSPHLNLGYEWNGSSILAGNLTGTTVSEANEAAVVQTGPATSSRLPSQLFYSLGADYGITRRLTLAVDYLGQTLINTPRVFQSSFTTAAPAGSVNPPPSQTLSTITAGKDTIGLNSGSVGVKYNLFDQLLFTANVLFRLDNKGLRQNVTPRSGSDRTVTSFFQQL